MLTRALTYVSLVLLSGATLVTAQVKLHDPHTPPAGFAFVTVVIAGAAPDLAPYLNANVWAVHIRTPSIPQVLTVPINSVIPTQLPGEVQINITPPPGLDLNTTKIDIVLKRDGFPTVTWSLQKHEIPTCKLTFNQAASAAKADVYLSGSWIPAVGAKPSYNIDSHMSLPVCLPHTWDLKFTGTVKTADHPNADPDSFSAGIALGPRYPFWGTPTSAFDFQWRAAQWEFSRKDEAFNFTTVPTFTYARGWFRTNPATHNVRHAGGLNVRFAPEIGENLRNHIAAIRNGYGGIARMVPGADFYLVFPRDNWGVRWTSTWDARILLTREPFIDYRRAIPASLGRGTRNSLSNTLEVNPNKLFAINIKHEYGSLPPAFKFVDHKVTVGLSISWSWH